MERVLPLLAAVPYIRLFKGETFVVKISGALLLDADALAAFADDVALLHHLGIRVAVIHGGGPQVDALSTRLGLLREVHGGRRVTDAETLDVAKMVFRGRLNSDVVGVLRARGLSPVGLSGADGGLVTAVRRPPVPVSDPESGETRLVDYGHVGDVTRVDARLARLLLDAGHVPVLCSLAATERGDVLNVNADTVAAEVAASLSAAKLVMLTPAAGLLGDVADATTLYSYLDMREVDDLVARGTVRGGMLPKVAACGLALRRGVPRVHLIDGFRPHSLLLEVFTNEGCGTLVVRDKAEEPPIPTGVQ